MYKILNVNGEEYKLEYSIEASLYNDCIEKVVGLMYNMDEGQNRKDVQKMLSGISDIPNTAIICLYAGLLEHHGTDVGDGSVPNIAAAKRIASNLLRNKENEIKNWYDVFTLCLEQMGEDGFFELIGLDAMLTAGEGRTRTRKTPKKVTKVSEA